MASTAESASNVAPGSLGAAIRVTGLCKGYGERPVLWELALEVSWAECVVLYGANGTGKTTLLKVLSTQARADSGEVRINNIDVRSDAAAVRRILGVVFHRHMLYEDLTAEENLRFYGRLYGLQDIQDRIGEVLQRVGLEERAGQMVRSLSNGMQKRLAIARAILHQPSILLLDEPESGLDSQGLDMLGGLIREWKDGGRSVVMATHNLEKGKIWGDRAAVLARGKLQPAASGKVLAGIPGSTEARP